MERIPLVLSVLVSFPIVEIQYPTLMLKGGEVGLHLCFREFGLFGSKEGTSWQKGIVEQMD